MQTEVPDILDIDGESQSTLESCGIGLKPINDTVRNDRIHFGLTWIPGRRW
jgi:hypothetical protein